MTCVTHQRSHTPVHGVGHLLIERMGDRERYRAIDIGEGEGVDADAFKALIKAAVAANRAAKVKR